jgi:hypothetical protein
MRAPIRRNVGQYVIFSIAFWREFLAVKSPSQPEQPGDKHRSNNKKARDAGCRVIGV